MVLVPLSDITVAINSEFTLLTFSVAFSCVRIAIDGVIGAISPRACFSHPHAPVCVHVGTRQSAIVVKVRLEQEIVALLRQISISRAHFPRFTVAQIAF
jgi:hypothetical protein